MASAGELMQSILTNIKELQQYDLSEYVEELTEIDTLVGSVLDDAEGDGETG